MMVKIMGKPRRISGAGVVICLFQSLPCHYLLRVFSHACPYALRISSIVMRPWYSPPLNFTERSMSLLFPEWQAVFFLPLAIVRSQAFLIVS